jgi:hypothetical protein
MHVNFPQIAVKRGLQYAAAILFPSGEWRSRRHCIFIADSLIRKPERQARFSAATIAQVSVCANKK